MQAFVEILRNELNAKIRVDPRRETQSVVVASGSYTFTPLPNAPRQPNSIHIYTDSLDSTEGAGGGGGNLNELFRHLENSFSVQFLNETNVPSDRQFEWANHRSGYVPPNVSASDRRVALGQLLDNLHTQTGLDFSIEDREVDMWVFAEEG